MLQGLLQILRYAQAVTRFDDKNDNKTMLMMIIIKNKFLRPFYSNLKAGISKIITLLGC